VHRVHHRQQRRAPRRDTDHFVRLERVFEVEGRRRAQAPLDARFVIRRLGVDHDRLVQPVPEAHAFFEIAIDAGGHADGDPHDALDLRALEEAGDGRLREIEPLGDLALVQPVGMIKLGDFGEQPEFFDVSGGKHFKTRSMNTYSESDIHAQSQNTLILSGCQATAEPPAHYSNSKRRKIHSCWVSTAIDSRSHAGFSSAHSAGAVTPSWADLTFVRVELDS